MISKYDIRWVKGIKGVKGPRRVIGMKRKDKVANMDDTMMGEGGDITNGTYDMDKEMDEDSGENVKKDVDEELGGERPDQEESASDSNPGCDGNALASALRRLEFTCEQSPLRD